MLIISLYAILGNTHRVDTHQVKLQEALKGFHFKFHNITFHSTFQKGIYLKAS